RSSSKAHRGTSRSTRSRSRTSAAGRASGSTRSTRRSRAATRWSRAAWRPACAPATGASTSSSPGSCRSADHNATHEEEIDPMDFTLELVVVPVTDVDRAKAFYTEQCGFHLDVDHSVGDHFRVVQMTPPGSACSISVGKGLSKSEPGSTQGLQLCVTDIE